ncbi:MAG TPA: CPBP family intramembrane glutamic endopeptidase [Steroidobacteraceae bacterium]|nr:CPBP family intramembrane glutamic endopeptidase [Steroidobacteraceae bacterium]
MWPALSGTRRLQISIGLLLTLGGINASLGILGERYSRLGPLLGHEVLWWALLVIVLLFVLRVERLPLASIELKRPTLATLWAIPAGIALVVGVPFIYFEVFPLLHLHMNSAEMSRLSATPFWYRLILVTRAAVCEETFCRGYAIPRIEELSGSSWLAVLVSWAAFTIAHLSSWGWPQLIVAGYGGAILTALFVWRRDLTCNIVAHFIGDGVGFLLG